MATLIRDILCEEFYDLPRWLLLALIPGKVAVRIGTLQDSIEFVKLVPATRLSHPEDIIDAASYMDLRCAEVFRKGSDRGVLMLVSVCELFPLLQEDFAQAETSSWEVEPERVDEWVFRGILSLKETLH
jgi:hypothetical protein